MDDAKKKEIEQKVDRLALQWSSAKADGEHAKAQKLRNDIWREMTELYFPIEKIERMGERFDEHWITFMDTLEEVSDKFRPDAEKSSFIRYFSRIYKFRKIDEYDDKKKEQNKTTSFDGDTDEDADHSYRNPQDILKDSTIADASESIMISDFLEDLMGLVLNFSDRYKGKANNSDKKNWYHLFYTEDITVFTKRLYKEQTQVLRHIHAREIFRALKHTYLNFYMSGEPCKNLQDIAYTKLKCYEEIIPNTAEKNIGKEIPSERKIPAEVSIQYLKQCENTTVGKSARSNQKKEYDADKRELFG